MKRTARTGVAILVAVGQFACSDDEVTIVRTEPPVAVTATATSDLPPHTPTPIEAATASPQPTATPAVTVSPIPTTPPATNTPGQPTVPATVLPTASPTAQAAASPTGTAVGTVTATATVPPTATATPDGTGPGPIVSHLGLSAADDLPISSVGTDAAGRPIYERLLGAGMNLIIEARPGSDGRPPGIQAYSETGLPDLQILISQPLGDGSEEVCDVNPEGPNGGVPAVDPPVFSLDPRTVDAINDLGCRVNDGTGLPQGRGAPGEACTRFESGAFGFVNSSSTVQYCLPIAQAWAFPVGDTIVTARVRSVTGSLGAPRQIVVRVTRDPVPTPIPVPPIVTHLGLVAADDRVVAATGVDDEGRDVFRRIIGSGFSLVIEAAPGPGGRPVGINAFTDGVTPPDLQILVSRDLGDGNPAVCDVDVENSVFGGVPGIPSLQFSDDAAVIDAINDLGCRVNDGTGAPVGRPDAFPCTRDAFGNFSFVNPLSTIQFCLPIARAWRFPDGETLVSARVRGIDGGLSAVSEIAVRVEPSPRDECEPGGPGERPFTVDLAASMLLVAGVEGNAGVAWVASESEFCAGPGTQGVFPLRLLRDFSLGAELPGGEVLCARLRATGSSGVLDCAGALAHDVRMFAENASGTVGLQTGLGEPAGAGSASITLPASFRVLPAGSSSDECFGAVMEPGDQIAITTARAEAEVLDPDEGGTLAVSAVGVPFDCAQWTAGGGPGTFVAPLATTSSSATGESASVLILPD